MEARLVRKKIGRGRYDILVDGESVGQVSGSTRDWRLRPRHVVVNAAGHQQDSERPGVWVSGDLLGEAVEALCDMQGLPAGIAWSLSHADEALTPAEEAWLQRFLGVGFVDESVYAEWVQQWQEDHPSSE